MPDWLKDWWPAIALAVTLALVPFVRWVWITRRRDLVTVTVFEAALKQAGDERRADLQSVRDEIRRDIKDTLEHHDERLDGLAGRLAHAEQHMETLPTRDHVEKLTVQLTTVGGQIGVLEERLRGVNSLQEQLRHQVNVIDGFIRQVRP